MRDFNRSDSGPRRNEERQTFKAVCADCGRDCDLPFKPTGSRPVYCRDCFKNHPQEDRPQRFESRGDLRGPRREDSRRGSSDRPMFSAVCDNCGKTCQLPFEPRAGKPVYCSRCFEDKEKGIDMSQRRSASNGTANSQMDAINAKLDKILNLLSNGKAEKKVEKIEKVADSEQSRRDVIFEAKPEKVEVKIERKPKKATRKPKVLSEVEGKAKTEEAALEAEIETPEAIESPTE